MSDTPSLSCASLPALPVASCRSLRSHVRRATFTYVLLFIPSLALAQGQLLGVIHGAVKDEQGGVLPGVVITATPQESRPPVQAITDQVGFYSLRELEPGEYAVKAELSGFATIVQSTIVARAGRTLSLDLVMTVGGVGETITVRRDTPLLEVSSATSAVNISGAFQNALPTSSRRNWSDALIVTPGVVSGDTSFGAQNYYVHGSGIASHVLQIDGADVASATSSQPLYVAFNPELIADVQVRTAGVDASAPIGTGAVINVATKSGTNKLAGTANVAYQARRWNGSNVPGGTSPSVQLVQPDLTTGGPIRKDRLWYFGAYRRVEVSTGVARSPSQLASLRALSSSFSPFDVENTANLYFFKLSAAPALSHRLSGFVQSDHNRFESATALDADPAAQLIGGLAVAGRWSSTWGTALTSETAVSYNDKTFESPASDITGARQSVYRDVSLSGGRWLGADLVANVGAPSSFWSSQPSTKLTLSQDVTYALSRGTGSHEIKIGLFIQPRLINESQLNYINGGRALESLVLTNRNDTSAGTTLFQRTELPSSVEQYRSRGSNLAVYVQDTWRYRRLTATAGIRADRVRYVDTLFNVVTQASTEIGPRVGLTFGLTSDAKSIVRFAITRIPDRGAGAAFAGTVSPTQTRYFDLNLDGSLDTIDVVPGTSTLSPTRVFDPQLHQPYVTEITGGLRQQLPGGLAFDAGFVRRLMKDRFTMLEINSIYDGGVFRGYRDESQSDIYRLTNNEWNWPIYTALEFAATKRTDRLELILSYTRQWQRLAGTWQPGDPASIVQPNAFDNNRGIGSSTGTLQGPATVNSLSGTNMVLGESSPWQDHVLRFGGTANLPLGLIAAANYTYQSGPWSGPIVMRLPAPDLAFGPATVTLSNGRVVSNPLATVVRFAFPTRSEGQFHMPALHTLNLRLGKTISIRSQQRLTVLADVFNVPNRGTDQGLLSGGNMLGSANYGIGRNRQVPRGAQLGVRFAF